MDFDNMTREELLTVLKQHYSKLVNPIPNRQDFEVGKYYFLAQTGNDELELYGNDLLYLTFAEANQYFE